MGFGASLRRALERVPDTADVHYALGLLLIRTGRKDHALAELKIAAAQGTEVPRYAYVYAVALFDLGQQHEAITQLEAAHRRFTGHRGILTALAQFSAAVGDAEAAARWTEALGRL